MRRDGTVGVISECKEALLQYKGGKTKANRRMLLRQSEAAISRSECRDASKTRWSVSVVNGRVVQVSGDVLWPFGNSRKEGLMSWIGVGLSVATRLGRLCRSLRANADGSQVYWSYYYYYSRTQTTEGARQDEKLAQQITIRRSRENSRNPGADR
jgi:hypothetical protein